MVRNGIVRYGMGQYDTVEHGIVQLATVWYRTLWHGMIRYSTVGYRTVFVRYGWGSRVRDLTSTIKWHDEFMDCLVKLSPMTPKSDLKRTDFLVGSKIP